MKATNTTQVTLTMTEKEAKELRALMWYTYTIPETLVSAGCPTPRAQMEKTCQDLYNALSEALR